MKNITTCALMSFILLATGLVNAMQKEITPAERDKLNDQLFHSIYARHDFDEISGHITAGADVEAKNANGDTPLIIAAGSGHTEAMRALLEARPNVNAKNNNLDTALHKATIGCQSTAVRMLLDAKADVGAENACGNTPLFDAIQGFFVIKALEKKTPLQLLIKAQAKVNVKDQKGNTPLHIAVKKKLPRITKKLLKAGADTTALDNNGHTPQDLAIIEYTKQPRDKNIPYVIEALAPYPTRDELSPILTAVLSMQQVIGKTAGKNLAKKSIVPVLIDDLIGKKLAFLKQRVSNVPDAELIKEIKTNIYEALNRRALDTNTRLITLDEAFGTFDDFETPDSWIVQH